MPNRMIKESICTSEQIDELTPFEETTFYRLMVNADDYGCFDGREKILAARLYPLKEINPADMRAAVDRLAEVGLVVRYTVEGREYLYFPTWFNHQRLRQTKHKFPPPVDAISGSLPHNAETCGNLPQIAADFSKTPPVAALARASTSTSTSTSTSVSSSDSVFDEEQNASDGDHWFNTETNSGSTMKDGEWMPDEDARKLQREQDEVLTAAENAGFDRTNLVRGKLLSLFAEHGREKMLFAIEESATHGAANLAYLSAVLSGKGGKKGKTGFEQRDYTAEQDAAVARMMADSWGDE